MIDSRYLQLNIDKRGGYVEMVTTVPTVPLVIHALACAGVVAMTAGRGCAETAVLAEAVINMTCIVDMDIILLCV